MSIHVRPSTVGVEKNDREGTVRMDCSRAKRVTFAMIGCGLCVVMCGCPGKNKGTVGSYGSDETIIPTVIENRLPVSRFDNSRPITGVSFEALSFRYDNYQVDPGESYKIDQVAEYMHANPASLLITEGHCDERGSREYNLSLGEHRSNAVRAYLISLGVDGNRIQTRTFGEEQPLDPGHGEAAWQRNRRAEFALFQ